MKIFLYPFLVAYFFIGCGGGTDDASILDNEEDKIEYTWQYTINNNTMDAYYINNSKCDKTVNNTNNLTNGLGYITTLSKISFKNSSKCAYSNLSEFSWTIYNNTSSKTIDFNNDGSYCLDGNCSSQFVWGLDEYGNKFIDEEGSSTIIDASVETRTINNIEVNKLIWTLQSDTNASNIVKLYQGNW
jgi:hypothetical protein